MSKIDVFVERMRDLLESKGYYANACKLRRFIKDNDVDIASENPESVADIWIANNY